MPHRRAAMTRISWLIPLVFAIAAHEQPYLNLDFETAARGRPLYRSAGSTGDEYTADSADFHSGNRSLRIRNVNAPPPPLGAAPPQLPIELAGGKRVRGTGWMKTA